VHEGTPTPRPAVGQETTQSTKHKHSLQSRQTSHYKLRQWRWFARISMPQS